MNSVQTLLCRSIHLALIAGFGSTDPVWGQPESPVELERVEVTGSRIKRAEIEGAGPLLILDRDDIEASGLTAIGDFLQDLTIAGSGLNTNVNNGGDGSIRLNLRNLGANRVLVLVNGRRWITIPTISAVDLQTIPVALIERVEILKDGASAIYGSDAIAGVVNIITRDDFTGARANAYHGQWGDGDGETTQADFSIGATGERSSVFMNASYTKQEPIFAGDREISKEPVFGTGNFFGSTGTPEGRVIIVDDPATGSIRDLTFDEGATFPEGAPMSAYRPFTRADNYNFAPDNFLLTPSERYSLYASGSYWIADHVVFFSDVLYNKRESSQLLAAQPLFLGAGLNDIYIPASNPFNPFGITLGTAVGGAPYFIGRRMLEMDNRIFNQDVHTYQFTGGIEGDFELGNRYWDWEVYYQFARNDQSEITFGLLNLDRIQQALDPALCNPDLDCVLLNLFGGAGGETAAEVVGGNTGTITPEMVDFITFVAQDLFASERNLYAGNLTGTLLDLPAGPLGMAVGYEYRREKGFDQPDSLLARGNTSGLVRQPTAGSFTVEETYVELSVPILADVAGFDMLEASLAARFSDYDTFGSTTNTKVGLRWQPSTGLLLRATRSEGFRAPSITEAFRPLRQSPFFGDPCSDLLGRVGSDTPGGRDTAQPREVIDNCIADGVPADGSYVETVASPVIAGGNPNAGPETAESTTLGIVYSPPFPEGLDIFVDYFEIELDDRISQPGVGTILQGCYFGGLSVLCDLVQRNAQTGAIEQIRNVVTNIGRTTTAGADIGIHWSLPETGIGFFELAWESSYVEEFVDVFVANGQFDEINRVGLNMGDDGFPRWKSNVTVNWSRGDWSGVYNLRYIHHQDEICPQRLISFGLCSGPINAGDPDEVAINHLESVVYHDTQLSYHFIPWDTRFTFGARNLFDKEPPLCFQCFANSYDPTIHDIPGRFWYLRVTSNF